MAYVYILFRHDGRPCYVGKGTGNRWLKHELHAHERGRHKNHHLRSIILQAKEAGKELPKIKLVDGVSDGEALEIEKLFIAAIGRELHGGPLVNLTDGGDGPSGYKPSAETIERQAATRRGRKMLPEQKAKISATLKGRPKSREHVLAAANAQRGVSRKVGWWSTEDGRAKQRANNPTVFKDGHKHSDETIARLKVSQAAVWACRRAGKGTMR